MENKKTRTATEKEIKVASKEVLKKHHKALENLADKKNRKMIMMRNMRRNLMRQWSF